MIYTICTVLLNSLFSLETCGPGNLEQDVHKVNCKDKSAKPRSCNSLSALQDRLPVLYGEESTGDNMAKMLLPVHKGEQVSIKHLTFKIMPPCICYKVSFAGSVW